DPGSTQRSGRLAATRVTDRGGPPEALGGAGRGSPTGSVSAPSDSTLAMPDAPPASALVVQTAFLGDVVLTTPLLPAPPERPGPVDVVTTPAAAALLETHPAVRRVRSYDKRGRARGLAGLLALAGA